MHSVQKTKAGSKHPDRKIDLREQPYNSRGVGPISQVQLPLINITSLHGVVLDIDRHLLRPDSPGSLILSSPGKFAGALIPMLDRDPVLKNAEIRFTGRGVHVIPWFDRPVEFFNDGERQRWAGVVEVVQSVLPIDPDQPGITALTRPVGSVNGKSGKEVKILHPGTPVPVAAVLELYQRMAKSPFRTLATILLGSERVSPCPICRAPGSTLQALDRVGRCYGSCGSVKVDRLYDAFLLPRTTPEGGGNHAKG